jgi:hypothetical protein
MDKRCGTCKWWEKQEQIFAIKDRGECRHPLPLAIQWAKPELMPINLGSTCPCWQSKEQEKEEK